jgi:hypothetical protein
MAVVLSAQAQCDAAEGDTDATLRDLRRMFALGRDAGEQPTLLGLLVNVSCDMIATACAERVADTWHTDAARLARLRGLLEHPGPEPNLRHALTAEPYFAIAILRNVGNMAEYRKLCDVDVSEVLLGRGLPVDARPASSLVRSAVPTSRFGKVMLCRVLQFWTRAYGQIAGLSDPVQIAKVLDEDARRERSLGESHAVSGALLGITLGDEGRSVLETRARRACTAALVAVLEFKARDGNYPRSVAEAGVTSKDPFGGKPLRLRVDGDSCRVYSLGSTGVDYGGVFSFELKGANFDDRKWNLGAMYPAH